MNQQHDDPVSLWTARPWTARTIRAFVFIAPLVISIVVAWVLSSVAPRPGSFTAGVVRWLVIALVSTCVLLAVDKLARRLLPLATLYGLTLAFPDQAPSRYHLALRNGSTAQLRVRIAEARAGKLGDTPEDAAERVLELVMALSVHDRLTRGHSERVRAYTQMIGEEMGLTDTELDRLRWAGLLHDVGKLMISGDILNKAGKLTDDEFETIKQHPEFGRRLVAPLNDWLGEAARAVWEHHERWDGNGYPRGLANTDISLAGRIVSVADAYDVMTSARSYKKPVGAADARAELTRCSGTQFDPAVVRAFMNLSLGRLRFAMGPLTWLAQLPMFPTAVAATATQGAATAATAFVGAAAASVGLGLSGQPIVPPSDSVAAEIVAAEARSRVVIDDDESGPRPSVVVTSLPGGIAATAVGADASAVAGAGGGAAVAAASTTTTTLQPAIDDGRGTTTTTTTVPAGPTVPVGDTTTTLAPTKPAPTTTVVAPPVTTVAATTTTVPPSPTTTVPPTTTTTPPPAPTTTVVRPNWLPAAGVATAFHFDMPGRFDPADGPLLALKTNTPNRNNAFDPDRDGVPGVTLARRSDDQPQPGGQLTFGWGGPGDARTAGPTSALVHVAAPVVFPVDVVLRGRLFACDAAGACAPIAETTAAASAAVIPVALTLDFGAIDAVVPAGGTIRIVIDVPPSSATDVVVLADTRDFRSALTLTFP